MDEIGSELVGTTEVMLVDDAGTETLEETEDGDTDDETETDTEDTEDGSTELVMFVVDSCVREEMIEERTDDGTLALLVITELESEAVALVVGLVVSVDETPVPAPLWLMPLDRMSDDVAVVLVFSTLLKTDEIDDRGSAVFVVAVLVGFVVVVGVVAFVGVVVAVRVVDVVADADSADSEDTEDTEDTDETDATEAVDADDTDDADDADAESAEDVVPPLPGNMTMPELDESFGVGALAATDVAEDELLVSVLESMLTTMVLEDTMIVNTSFFEEDVDASLAWELDDVVRLFVVVSASVRLVRLVLAKISGVVCRFVVPGMLEAESATLDSEAAGNGVVVSDGGWGWCCVLVALTKLRLICRGK